MEERERVTKLAVGVSCGGWWHVSVGLATRACVSCARGTLAPRPTAAPAHATARKGRCRLLLAANLPL